nr:hypothetical protein [Tanacetum cinerariifolium]
MKELCQPSLNGRGGPIAPIAIQATNFGLKNDMIQQSIKVNGVTDDALRLYLFPHFLTHHATAWFDRLPRNSINTFEQMAIMFLEKYFPPSMVTKLRNEITNFRQLPDESLFEAWEHYKHSIDRRPNHNMLHVTQIDTFYNGLTLRHRDTINAAAGGTFMKRRPEECYDLIKNMTAHHNDWDTSAQRITLNCNTCGGPHSFSDYPATIGKTQNGYAVGAYQCNSYQPQGNRNLLSYRSDNYLGPPGFNQNQNYNNQNHNFQNKNRNQGNHNPQRNNQGRNQFFQGANQVNSPIIVPVASPVSALRPNQRPSIPFADALILMPKYGPSIKSLLTNKDKLFRVAEDVFVKVGTFHFSADFVVIDFDDDPRVPLILGRSYLKTERDLIDVFKGELTLRVAKEAITFNLDQTSKYSANYNDMMENRIDVIDMACEEYSQEVFGFENRPPMLNKENYVPWPSRLFRYAKSRPNGKLIHNSIINGPYIRRMILEPGDLNHEVPVNETFHVQTDDELTEKELK